MEFVIAPMVLPVLFHTQESSEMERLGIDYDASSLIETRDVTFWNIDFYYPSKDYKTMTSMQSSGELFLVNLPFNELDNMIRFHKHMENNPYELMHEEGSYEYRLVSPHIVSFKHTSVS